MDRTKEKIGWYWNWRSASYGLDDDKSLEVAEDWEATIKGLVSRFRDKTPRALDVGTGTGQLAFYLARAGCDVTGIDLSREMIAEAGKQGKNRGLAVDFRTGDAENLPFEDNTFDVVVSRNLVWTLPSPEAAVREWRRVLKPGGRIIISDGFWQNQTWTGIHRLLIKTARNIMQKSSLISFRFFLNYAGLIPSLPLYEGVPLTKMGEMMAGAGFKKILFCNIRDCFRSDPYGSKASFFIAYSDK